MLLSKQEKVKAISRAFQEHEEYFLYIFDEEEYRELVKWIVYPQNQIIKDYKAGLFLKAVGIWLADIVDNGKEAGIAFA